MFLRGDRDRLTSGYSLENSGEFKVKKMSGKWDQGTVNSHAFQCNQGPSLFRNRELSNRNLEGNSEEYDMNSLMHSMSIADR